MPTCQPEGVLSLIVTEKTAIYMPGINPKSGMRPRVSFWSQKVISRCTWYALTNMLDMPLMIADVQTKDAQNPSTGGKQQSSKKYISDS